MKICTVCDIKKNENEFGKRKASLDGLSPRCRKCQSDYDRNRKNLKERSEARKEYQKTDAYKRSQKKSSIKYGKTENGKARTKRWQEANPEKRKVHGIVAYSLKKGALIKQPCEVCGEVKVHAHHDDYSKPLDVRWLCNKCHNEHHKNE